MNSTSRSSGDVPEHTRPASSSAAAVLVVDLVAVAVALVDDLFAVGARATSVPAYELGRVRAEPHRAAHVDDLALLVHEVDDRDAASAGRTHSSWRRTRPHTSRANSMTAQCRPRHRPRNGTLVLAGVAGGGDLALDAPEAESAGDHDAVEIAEPALGEQALGVVGRDPVDRAPARRTRSHRGAAPRRPTDTRRAGSRTCRRGRCAPPGRRRRRGATRARHSREVRLVAASRCSTRHT